MTITITAYDWVPPFARGHVRDLRVRWALEEVGEPYAVRYVAQGSQKDAGHRVRQPYGQVPTYEEGGLTLFETGAIVDHVAATRPGLFPADGDGRARARMWMYAALNTVEPPVMDLLRARVFEADQSWSAARRPSIEARVRKRLAETAGRLDGRDWLEGAFSAGDLLMVDVLRTVGDALLAEQPALAAYVARGTARPAFGRALTAQMAGFTGSPPGRGEAA